MRCKSVLRPPAKGFCSSSCASFSAGSGPCMARQRRCKVASYRPVIWIFKKCNSSLNGRRLWYRHRHRPGFCLAYWVDILSSGCPRRPASAMKRLATGGIFSDGKILLSFFSVGIPGPPLMASWHRYIFVVEKIPGFPRNKDKLTSFINRLDSSINESGYLTLGRPTDWNISGSAYLT